MKKHLWVTLSFLVLFSFIFYMLGHKKRPDAKEKFIEENKELFDIIDNYTFQTPILYIVGKSYPSTHIFFHSYEKDTIMSIVSWPTLLENDTWWINTIYYKSKLNFIKNKKFIRINTPPPDGIFWLTKRQPVIFFNMDLYKPSFKTHLKPNIPDSLKRNFPFGSFHGHKQWFYLYKNGKFIKINLIRDSIYKDKPYYIIKKENVQDSILPKEDDLLNDIYPAENDTIKVIVKQNEISKILIPDVQKENFTYLKYKNKAKIVNQLYLSLLNMILKFEPDFQLKKISYKVNMRFKALQYITDDSPAYPLDFDDMILRGKNLETNQPYIKLPHPDFLNPQQHSAFAQMFNFDNDTELIHNLEQKYLKFIEPLSLKKQEVAYKKILNNIDDYRDCCPEYIKQAEAFFKKKQFNSFDDLSVEIYPDAIFLHITLMGQNGESYNLNISNLNKE